MKIKVEHEIPCDSGLELTCKYAGDFCGNEVCKYHTYRDRMHGRKAPVERHLPKCTLFDEWLPDEYHKCDKCIAAMAKETEQVAIKTKRRRNVKHICVVCRKEIDNNHYELPLVEMTYKFVEGNKYGEWEVKKKKYAHKKCLCSTINWNK